jgi:ABC-type transport system substrate-binding protein
MKLPAWTLLVLSSIAIAPAGPASRPRYGGTLSVELSAPPDFSRPGPFTRLIAETLVRENERGEIQPGLASAWQHDGERKRWRFTLRPRVRFHDGRPLDAASVVASLRLRGPDVAVTGAGQIVTVASDRPLPSLLSELALSRCAIVRKNDAGLLIGTGPFRATQGTVLSAFDDYWGGRPYLDALHLRSGGASRTADVWDVPVGGTRRILPDRTRLWASQPAELLALLVPASIREALSLSIDRASIVNVLTQRQGEASAALLPNWLTGYAFLFSTSTDLGRSRELVATEKAGPLPLGYPAADPLARAVADRIAVNARDTGLVIQPTPSAPSSAARLIRLRIESLDPTRALQELAADLDLTPPSDSPRPEAILQSERALLAGHRIVPIAHLPEIYALAPRVHYRGPVLRFEDVWLDP